MSVRRSIWAPLLALVLLPAYFAASATAAPEWRVTSIHGPQNMAPGDGDAATVEGQYVIQVFNEGDTNSEIGTTLTDVLPAGVTAVAASGRGTFPESKWDCSGTPFPAGTVSCVYEVSAPAPGATSETPGEVSFGTSAFFRGGAQALVIDVSVAPGASGSALNEVEVSGGGAPSPASAVDLTPFSAFPAGFGFIPGSYGADVFDGEFPGGAPTRQAGSHPFEMRVDFNVNLALGHDPDDPALGDLYYTYPDGSLKTIETRLPVGMFGDPQAVPRCPRERMNFSGPSSKGSCPAGTQVGAVDLILNQGKQLRGVNPLTDTPVYNIEPPEGAVAALGFQYLGNPVYLVAEVDPAQDHAIVTRISNTIELLNTRSVKMTLWGVPADPAHDALRQDPDAGFLEPQLPMASPAPIRPFLTLPAQCDTAASIDVRADSWQNPGAFTPWQEGTPIALSGCEDPRFRFEPQISMQTTSAEAGSPTGLKVQLSVPQKDDAFPSGSPSANAANAAKLYAANGNDVAIPTPHVKDSVTVLPAGMTVNPAAADGLVGCSEQQVDLNSNADPACPDASKIGTVEIDSGLVPTPLKGFIYQAKQSENPFGSILAFYTVAKGPGLTIKLAAEVKADPQTGRLTTVFKSNPQLTFSNYRLSFWGGERAPLVNPPTCGTFEGTGTVSSWNSSMPVAHVSDKVSITGGPDGAPCPDGLSGRPFGPSFDAKSLTPIAGSFSEFALEVARLDGTQELQGLEATLPAGMLAKLAGVAYCPEPALAGISAAAGSGLAERLSPSCPEESLVGHSDAAAGAGRLPLHNAGNVYLTGPYKGAPLGLAIVTPVVAGPLDLGSIVVRTALHVDPVTAQVGVVSDPIPDRLVVDGNGFVLNLRSVRVSMDRPGFTVNPTSCEPMAVSGLLTSLQGAAAKVFDRFQVGACAALGLEPKLSLRLKGKTRRSGHPALTATLRMPEGGANVTRAAVALPRSEFLAQAHIRTVCTRVQYAAGGGGGADCPAGSVYGYATAYSPLLDAPLQGPVYLRSSDNPLPDLVASLGGQIHLDLVGRIDSVRGGIRTTFDFVPDAPVSRFVLQMKGGKRGLLENSVDLCARKHRARAAFDAHNGRVADLEPLLKPNCGGKARKQKRR